MKKIFLLAWFVGSVSALHAGLGRTPVETPWVHEAYKDGDFKLAQGTTLANVFVAPEDFKVVQIAGGLLTEDIERVTGHKPSLISDAAKLNAPVVIVGTLGQSPLIDKLAADGKFDAKQISGQWECYLITTVANPLPGVSSALVIAGSDRRGTAYGVFELSRGIGVSPWYWWADVTPDHKDNLFVTASTQKFGPPSVQYRGIFINDEDWGMNPWAAKTFEPEVGNMGPKTYAKIFELLLRLKANTMWPAMHAVSTPFNAIPANAQVADDYGIVMGSSHCEPMLRNNVGEWKAPANQFNFITNPAGVTKYWEERMQTNGKFENLYTIGIRGIHDDPMMGAKGAEQVVPALEKIFGVQRNLIAKYVNPDPTKVPQIFCPYKEVLAYYLSNLQVPPDVTVVFPDDNFGYIRYLPTPEQIAARPGGFGVYYHISYLGAPYSYVWLNTTPPALIWEEMSKAYDHGVQKFWMLNVGDLKPGEIGIDFFMQMAWDEKKWNLQTLPDYLKEWATLQFGSEHADEIAGVMDQYYRLGYQRKPEELQWNIRGEPARPSDLTPIDYGDETSDRLSEYSWLNQTLGRLDLNTPGSKKAAFFELVGYPVQASALANERVFEGELASYYLPRNVAALASVKTSITDAENQLSADTQHFNDDIVGGKWKNMMPDDVMQKDRSYRVATWQMPAILNTYQPGIAPGIGVMVEGNPDALVNGGSAALPLSDPFTVAKHFFTIYDAGASHQSWNVRPGNDWLTVASTERFTLLDGSKSGTERFLITIDWTKAPKGVDVSGNIVITDGKSTFTVKVPIYNPAEVRPEQLKGYFVESDHVVSMEAQHFSAKTDKAGAGWQIIPGLGRTGDAVGVFPTTTPSVDIAKAATDAPALEYNFYMFSKGDVTIHYNLIPTQPIKYGTGLRFAVAIDDGAPQLVEIKAGTGSESGTSAAWQHNVLDNTTATMTKQNLAAAGAHKLKIYMIDPGVLLEKIVIDAGGLRPSYLGPPETRVADAQVAP